ncbi:MAG: transporter [Rhizorhabdus sp.]|nr:transporter [Rhizorhabdus sp.]
MSRRLNPLFAFALILPLSGCISFGEKPPAHLLSLTSDAHVEPATTRTAQGKTAISVAVPVTVAALRNQRIAVATNGGTFAYLPKALWTDIPTSLFRTVLAETIEAKTGRFVPDSRNATITPDTRLAGTLSAFQLLGGQGKVIVIYDATLAKAGVDTIRTRRFEATVPTASEEPDSVAAALNRASNLVASDVAAWVVE